MVLSFRPNLTMIGLVDMLTGSLGQHDDEEHHLRHVQHQPHLLGPGILQPLLQVRVHVLSPLQLGHFFSKPCMFWTKTKIGSFGNSNTGSSEIK